MTQKASTYQPICLARMPLLRNTKLRRMRFSRSDRDHSDSAGSRICAGKKPAAAFWTDASCDASLITAASRPPSRFCSRLVSSFSSPCASRSTCSSTMKCSSIWEISPSAGSNSFRWKLLGSTRYRFCFSKHTVCMDGFKDSGLKCTVCFAGCIGKGIAGKKKVKEL